MKAGTDLLGSPGRFGFEWGHYREILPESKAQLEQWLGSTPLESCRGKSILDVGCGMGRNPFWMLKAGARSVLAVDLDDRSLGAARENLGGFANATVRKLSVYELDPAALGRFDRVTCIGVLHHLSEPSRALGRMWDCVGPGGDLIVWCYAREGNQFFLPLIRLARGVGSVLPVRLTHAMARIVTVAAWVLTRLIPFRTPYYRNLRRRSYRNLESIVFDQMIPHISNYWDKLEIDELFSGLPGNRTVEFVQGNSWHIRVTKPVDKDA